MVIWSLILSALAVVTVFPRLFRVEWHGSFEVALEAMFSNLSLQRGFHMFQKDFIEPFNRSVCLRPVFCNVFNSNTPGFECGMEFR